MSNPFQNIGRNAACLSVIAITSVIVVKSQVKNRKEAKYVPPARATPTQEKFDDHYDNIAEIRPGFPIKEEGERRERKSIYEGPGVSRESRKKGDKLGLFDRWWG